MPRTLVAVGPVLKLTQHGSVVVSALYHDISERLATVAVGQLPGGKQTGSHPLPGTR